MNNELIARYKQLKQQIEQLQTEQDELKAELMPQVVASGGTLYSDDGMAQVVSGQERVTYDARALDQIITDNDWLSVYRKVTKVKPFLKIS